MYKKWINIALIIVYTAFIAVLGSYFVTTSSQAYNDLILPSFVPPTVVFIGAWTVIYIFTSLSAIITYNGGQRGLLLVYGLNGALNALWTYVFFHKGNPGGALVVLGLLLGTVVVMIRKNHDERAKLLLLPYLFWLLTATVLNYSIVVLN